MKKTNLLLTICAAMGLTSISPAIAAAPVGIAGSISGLYSNTSFTGTSGIAKTWGMAGSAAYGFGNDVAAQVDGSYSSINAPGVSGANLWGIGGSLMYAPAMGRFGGTVTYNSVDGAGSGIAGSSNATSYGGFGDYYASDMFTVSAKVGGISSSLSGCASGFGCLSLGSGAWYIGGAGTGYITPDIALSGSIEYLGSSGVGLTNYGGQIEFLFSESMPLSLVGSYHYTQLSGTGSGGINTWLVAVKFYFNQDNSMSLRDRQRNGAATWSVAVPQIGG